MATRPTSPAKPFLRSGALSFILLILTLITFALLAVHIANHGTAITPLYTSLVLTTSALTGCTITSAVNALNSPRC